MREIGLAIEEVANVTCKAAAALENELTVRAEDSEVGSRGYSNEDVIELTAGYDMVFFGFFLSRDDDNPRRVN